MSLSSVRLAVSLMPRLVAVLVIISLATFRTAIFLTLHVHVLPDGRVVVHSHPVDKEEEQKSHHEHTDSEYALLTALGHLPQSEAAELRWSQPCFEPVPTRIEATGENLISPPIAGSPDKRAPPQITSG